MRMLDGRLELRTHLLQFGDPREDFFALTYCHFPSKDSFLQREFHSLPVYGKDPGYISLWVIKSISSYCS